MKFLGTFMYIALISAIVFIMHEDHLDAVSQARLAQQWQDYDSRFYNGREHGDDAKIEEVAHFYGVDWRVLKGMRQQENGWLFCEMGFNGKTGYVSQSWLPPMMQYAEAARRLAEINASFPLQFRQPDYWMYLAECYHHGTKSENKDWSRNVKSIFDKLSKKKAS